MTMDAGDRMQAKTRLIVASRSHHTEHQPAEVVHSELPDPFGPIKTDKFCVLLGGSFTQLPGEPLLLFGVCGGLPSGFVPLEDLVQSDLSRLVQAISQVWLGWPTRRVHL